MVETLRTYQSGIENLDDVDKAKLICYAVTMGMRNIAESNKNTVEEKDTDEKQLPVSSDTLSREEKKEITASLLENGTVRVGDVEKKVTFSNLKCDVYYAGEGEDRIRFVRAVANFSAGEDGYPDERLSGRLAVLKAEDTLVKSSFVKKSNGEVVVDSLVDGECVFSENYSGKDLTPVEVIKNIKGGRSNSESSDAGYLKPLMFKEEDEEFNKQIKVAEEEKLRQEQAEKAVSEYIDIIKNSFSVKNFDIKRDDVSDTEKMELDTALKKRSGVCFLPIFDEKGAVETENFFTNPDYYATNLPDGSRATVILADFSGTLSVKEAGKEVRSTDFSLVDGHKYYGRYAVMQHEGREWQMIMVATKKGKLYPSDNENLAYITCKVDGRNVDTAFYHNRKDEKLTMSEVFDYLSENNRRGRWSGCSYEGPVADMSVLMLRRKEVESHAEKVQRAAEEAERIAAHRQRVAFANKIFRGL